MLHRTVQIASWIKDDSAHGPATVGSIGERVEHVFGPRTAGAGAQGEDDAGIRAASKSNAEEVAGGSKINAPLGSLPSVSPVKE